MWIYIWLYLTFQYKFVCFKLEICTQSKFLAFAKRVGIPSSFRFSAWHAKFTYVFRLNMLFTNIYLFLLATLKVKVQTFTFSFEAKFCHSCISLLSSQKATPDNFSGQESFPSDNKRKLLFWISQVFLPDLIFFQYFIYMQSRIPLSLSCDAIFFLIMENLFLLFNNLR